MEEETPVVLCTELHVTADPFTRPQRVARYPMALSYKSDSASLPQRSWDLLFMSLPAPAILFSGDTPTRDEIIEVLMAVNAPIWMIGVVEVCAAVARCEPGAGGAPD